MENFLRSRHNLFVGKLHSCGLGTRGSAARLAGEDRVRAMLPNGALRVPTSHP